MARKRTKKADQIDSTATATAKEPETIASAVDEVIEKVKSHAESVGRREGYSSAGITDVLAGARLLEHQNPYMSIIRFEEEPSQAVKDIVQNAGFQYRGHRKEWTRPVRFESRAQDRITAERTFGEVCKVIREEKGITHSYGGAA